MALDQLKRDLLVLVPQTNPVLRPIGHEYQEIVALLARGKRRGSTATPVASGAHPTTARCAHDRDRRLLNWFEATQMNSGSGNFTGYLKALDQSQVPAPRRHDPLSVYVDALEDQFGD